MVSLALKGAKCDSLALFRARGFFRVKVGLGEAAKRGVGTGANQLPDMSSFLFVKGNPLSYELPGGLIIKAGNVGISAAEYSKAVTFAAAFPSACVAGGILSTEESSNIYAFGQCVSRSAGGLLLAAYGGVPDVAPNVPGKPITFSWFAVGY